MTTSWTITSSDPEHSTEGESHSRVEAAAAIGLWLRESIARVRDEERPRFTIAVDGSIAAVLQLGTDNNGNADISSAYRQIDHVELSLAT